MQIKFINKRKDKEGGVVTLIAVIIIGFIVTTLVFTSSIYNRLFILDSRIFSEHSRSKYFSETCVEFALMEIWDNTSFTGSDVFSDGPLICEYNVLNNGTDSKLIHASSSVNNKVYLTEVDITITSTNIEIDYWNRVSNF